jgi:hypothetical protein
VLCCKNKRPVELCNTNADVEALDVYRHAFFTLAPNGVKWSASDSTYKKIQYKLQAE